jgi:uncharacterized small protein (DUF1192 family)
LGFDHGSGSLPRGKPATPAKSVQFELGVHYYLVAIQDRVASLLLEVKRLKAQLAAKAGSEELLSFLLETSGESLTFVQDLQNKVGYVHRDHIVVF